MFLRSEEAVTTPASPRGTLPEPIIAASFATLLGDFRSCFTVPSFAVFQHMMSGWLLCIGRHTVTSVIVAADVVGVRHHTTFQRFFRCGRWQPDDLGLVLLRMVLGKLVPPFAPVLVALDDTLARHTGKRISSAGMHRDPLLSTGAKVAYHFGHVWVVLAVVVHMPWGKSFALPVLARLYRSKKTCKRMGIPHRKKTELAVELIAKMAAVIPKRRILLVVDNGFANRNVIADLPANVHLIGRGVIDARIYAKPPPRKQGQRGRTRVMGKKLPSPEERAADVGARWETVDVEISGRPAQVKVQVFDALWHKSGRGRFLRFVLVCGWPGHKKDDVLISTDTTLGAKEIIQTYCLRWPIEETFHWCKSKLDLEQPQNRVEHAVLRTAPMALWAYSLVVLWYATIGKHTTAAKLPVLPWYQSKKAPAFSDMLAILRRVSWAARLHTVDGIPDRAGNTRSIQNSIDAVLDAVGYG